MKPFPFLGIVNLQKKLKPVTERSYKELTPLSPSKTTDLTSVTQRQTKTAKLQHLFLKTKISHSTTKNSSAQNGIIIGYAANTNQGIVRSYNEDRVTIILNFIQPKEKNLPYWPKCSFFGLYDGHGGSLCAEYLRDYLHHFILGDPAFPQNPEKAIQNGFHRAEEEFINQSMTKGSKIYQEKSGSCAIIALIVDSDVYIANVGDSRAFISMNKGQIVSPLSVDHKPCNAEERKRIIENGGRIYQNKLPANAEGEQMGPLRIFPGGLSVSRTIGDANAKLKQLEGLPNVISSVPDITKITVKEEHDFIFIGCDGIFDRLSNTDVSSIVWNARISDKCLDVHDFCRKCIENIITESLVRQSYDNVTGILIAFNNLQQMSVDTPCKANKSRNNVFSPVKMSTNYMELIPSFKLKSLHLSVNKSIGSVKIRKLDRVNSHRLNPEHTLPSNAPEVIIRNISTHFKGINSRKAWLKPVDKESL